MSSTRNRRPQTSSTPNQTPLLQRRLKTKPALIVIAILLLGNFLWFIAWLIPNKGQEIGSDEQVAAVDGDVITRQEWMIAMEERYGKETLQNLVNESVMEKAADKYKIKVSNQEIDLELALMRSAQDKFDTALQNLSADQLKQKIRSGLILDKVLTKDVVIKEDSIKKYYEENKALYNTDTSYRTNFIEVDSKKAAEEALSELKNGSDFSVLAREISIDSASASLGGDIGFLTEKQGNIDPALLKAVKTLSANEISKVFKLDNGHYGIVQVQEVIEGQSFTYDDVKEHIERELALEQLQQSITPEAFWSEFKATWYYGEEKK
ncbi:foldase [Lysinibacillus sphaericus]|uniref:peptidylprolyl isomerase n=4 Tax=Lysinibacillus TaxID=400634 RepID=A0A2S0K6H0_LYSSH|nr:MULTISPECIES: peptidyl-prolyl cis-trans isomerase [Lysinibacillus]AHN20127.1 Foldase prsA precursor [Lysinibacillus varians]AVK98899.1 foldase [Lysinibacillus sphaericus]MCS1384606.1 peptidyl-prolyl cis-trans isomerase [Lysinibacillus sphaericus]MED4545236.1 peptidyl-prolyl cis-trans isomerase [Lysinibacillus sphaericus]TKI18300.1 foldase [Lysinibacillus sphaericus]